ncbi:hypothetical protein SAMN04489727_3414 [Amycolatopsis tolypomycina]|uniref:Uncharacterized protein n=1 Tax=Amycolatopsis tolypomycina TaxID=208445 RepID=A0A1H4RR30_9PSEU|nr:hypothetical protein [Amycolatopsis tolypomycina]SEC34309.1 hypothetical protein SAMN04489727_3414 [Amycolatopsis tolypomycina]
MSVPASPGPHEPHFPLPPAPRPRRRKWPWVVGVLVVLPALAAGIVLATAFGKTTASPCLDKSQQVPCVGPGQTWISADGVGRPRDAAAPATTSPSIPALAAPATTEPALPEPTPKDYSVELAIQSKQCFGSAGCNVVVEPKLNFLGASTLLWECDITYSISGDTSGELIETAYAQGGTAYRVDRTSMSTKTSKVVPQATVTAVSCRKP